MPVFTFSGKSANGEKVSGERTAASKQALVAQLRRERITPVFASGRSFDRDYNRLRRTISKGDAQRESEDNRETVGPE